MRSSSRGWTATAARSLRVGAHERRRPHRRAAARGRGAARGTYELRFAVGAYFAAHALPVSDPPFLGIVPVRFGVADPGRTTTCRCSSRPGRTARTGAADAADAVCAAAHELGAISEEPDRLTRRFATPRDARGRTRSSARGWREAGMQSRVDAVGNLIGRRECGDAATLLARLAPRHGARRRPLRRAARRARRHRARRAARGCVAAVRVEVLGVRRRGGSALRRPPTSEPASWQGASGSTTSTARDADGVAMRDALRDAGGAPDAIPGQARSAETLLGLLELHIEQGPLLESLDRHGRRRHGDRRAHARTSGAATARRGTRGRSRWRSAAIRWSPRPHRRAGRRHRTGFRGSRGDGRRAVGRAGRRQRDPGSRHAEHRPPVSRRRVPPGGLGVARRRRGPARDPGRRGAATARARAHRRGGVRSAPPRAARRQPPRRAASTRPRSSAAPATTP